MIKMSRTWKDRPYWVRTVHPSKKDMQIRYTDHAHHDFLYHQNSSVPCDLDDPIYSKKDFWNHRCRYNLDVRVYDRPSQEDRKLFWYKPVRVRTRSIIRELAKLANNNTVDEMYNYEDGYIPDSNHNMFGGGYWD